ncbi:hypothetical protein ACPF7Z_15730 [Halomonas sp. GXIMD04776]|uniref:hypothetical protein n=1 Tax=Halomonas sp. GXIMD04776 TaxID=3415605 RepID=UPI003C98BB38
MTNPENPTTPNTSSSGSTSTGTATSHHDDMKEKGRQTADEVRDAARAQAEGMFDHQKGVAADQAESLSTVFRKMAKEFEAQDQRYFSGYANNIARATDAISQRLREQNLDTLMYQLQDYSRRQPAVFLGGAIAAGFFLARFLNSSQQHSPSNASYSGSSTLSAPGTANTTPGAGSTTPGAPSGSPGSSPY